ncbi:MAG: hypothetical protein ACXWWC_16430 [Chitinophagaceae bacterium]
MKYLLLLSIHFAFSLAIISCSKKDNTGPQTPPPPAVPLFQVRVAEYITNIPIANAAMSTYSCKKHYISCSEWSLLYSNATNTNGICMLPADKLWGQRGKVIVTADNYWSYTDEEWAFLYGSNLPSSIHYPRGDSILISLLPVVKVKIHAKGINDHNDSSYIKLSGHAIFNDSTLAGREGSVVLLKPKMDTSFYLPAFGMMKNQFLITKLYGNLETLYEDIRYIAKGDSVILEIEY